MGLGPQVGAAVADIDFVEIAVGVTFDTDSVAYYFGSDKNFATLLDIVVVVVAAAVEHNCSFHLRPHLPELQEEVVEGEDWRNQNLLPTKLFQRHYYSTLRICTHRMQKICHRRFLPRLPPPPQIMIIAWRWSISMSSTRYVLLLRYFD